MCLETNEVHEIIQPLIHDIDLLYSNGFEHTDWLALQTKYQHYFKFQREKLTVKGKPWNPCDWSIGLISYHYGFILIEQEGYLHSEEGEQTPHTLKIKIKNPLISGNVVPSKEYLKDAHIIQFFAQHDHFLMIFNQQDTYSKKRSYLFIGSDSIEYFHNDEIVSP